MTTKEIKEIFLFVENDVWNPGNVHFSTYSYGGRLYQRVDPKNSNDGLVFWSKDFSEVDEKLATKLESVYRKYYRENKLNRIIKN